MFYRPEDMRVIAIDDWMIWARSPYGRIVETCAELWPEWLNESQDPSDMDTPVYRATVLRILRHKQPNWTDTAKTMNDPHDPEALPVLLADLIAMAIEQAAFIAEHK